MLVRSMLVALISVGSIAHAETVFLDNKPTSVMKPGDAAKASKTKPVYKCEKVKQGPNINPVKVAGTPTLWVQDAGAGIEDAGDKLADGKTLYRCKTVAIDSETGRMKAATL